MNHKTLVRDEVLFGVFMFIFITTVLTDLYVFDVATQRALIHGTLWGLGSVALLVITHLAVTKKLL